MRHVFWRGRSGTPARIARLVLTLTLAIVGTPRAADGGAVEVAAGYDPSLTIPDGDPRTLVVAFLPTARAPVGQSEPFSLALLRPGDPPRFGVVPFAASPFTGSLVGEPLVVAGNAPGTFLVVASRVNQTDPRVASILIAPYDASGAPASPLEVRPEEGRTLVAPAIDVDRTTSRGGGPGTQHDGTSYLVFDAVDALDRNTYLGSALQLLSPQGIRGPAIVLSQAPFTPAFKGAQFRVVAGTADGTAYAMGTGVDRADRRMISQYVHAIVSDPTLATTPTRLGPFRRPGQALDAPNDVYGVNGNHVTPDGILAVDRRNGTLYAVFGHNPSSDDPSRDQGDVRLAVSSDRGSHWTLDDGPRRVRVPEGAAGKTQFLPALHVDDNGWVHVAYYQNESGARDGGVLNADMAHVYYVTSKDGGATWQAPVRVSGDATGLRLEDPPVDRGLGFGLLGSGTDIASTTTAAATEVHVCWSAYDRDRPDTPELPRRFVACSTVTNPFCGDGARDPGEACDDDNTVSGDCCSSTCQAEAGASCNDHARCTIDDVCDASGACGGRAIEPDDVLARLSWHETIGQCDEDRLPEKLKKHWRRGLRLVERSITHPDKRRKLGRLANRQFVRALDARPHAERAGDACYAHLKEHLQDDHNLVSCLEGEG